MDQRGLAADNQVSNAGSLKCAQDLLVRLIGRWREQDRAGGDLTPAALSAYLPRAIDRGMIA